MISCIRIRRCGTMGLLPDAKNCGLHMHRECRERFPRHRLLAIPTCITARAWCTPGSLPNGFLWSRWRGKRSRLSRRIPNPQFTGLNLDLRPAKERRRYFLTWRGVSLESALHKIKRLTTISLAIWNRRVLGKPFISICRLLKAILVKIWIRIA